MALNSVSIARCVGLGMAVAISAAVHAQIRVLPLWSGYGANAQHTGQSPWVANPSGVGSIIWQTPMDTNPSYSSGELLAHYGEPCITPTGNVMIAVAHGTGNPFTIKCLEPYMGNTIWTANTAYVLPSHSWTPSVGPVLFNSQYRPGARGSGGSTGITAAGGSSLTPAITPVALSCSAAWPEIGGQIAIRSNADAKGATVVMHAFYGDAAYAANTASMNSNVKVCTPLTAGSDGSIYFGVYVEGPNTLSISSGLAVIRPNGTGTIDPISDLSGGDGGITQVQINSAPAISADGSRVYVAVSAGYGGRGYLVAVNTKTMTSTARVALTDPLNHQPALVLSDGTSSPLVAPDGSVYMGVLENSLGSNHFRGWMLHFPGTLAVKPAYLPGQFGWDITGSIIPSKWIPNYPGSSSYLLVCKYNNYAGAGGDGLNRVAVLDPSLMQVNAANGVHEMAEIETVLGQTPDPAYTMTHPGAVKEWCINSIAIDMTNKWAILNSEDGTVYEWNLNSNTLAYKIALTGGLGEAYTSTAIGPLGTIYAISNATLYEVF